MNPVERVAGRHFTLSVARHMDQGPWYPHHAEETTEHFYRFFAGCLAGVAPSSTLPSHHAVSSPDAASWDFEGGEPGGSWIALKFDRRRDIISIASGLFKLQRWYYTCQDGDWYLSNSLLYLHRVLRDKLEIELKAIPYMLQFGYLPFQFTPLKEVFGLRSGRVLVIERGQPRLAVRARIPVHRRAGTEREDVSAKIADVLREAVALRVKDLDSVILPLSGGIDSRFLLGCALEILPRESITTLTYGHPHSLDFSIGTGLARKVGVKHVGLPMDERPIGDILADNFPNSEGMYWTYPDYPVRPFRDALPQNAYVLSGYAGEGVFGYFDLPDEKLHSGIGQSERQLIRWVKELTLQWTSTPSVEECGILQPELCDFREFEAEVLALPGSDLQEKYNRWLFEGFKVNRVNFAVEVHRDRAFYLAPFIHPSVLDLAYALPDSVRRRQKAYFDALKQSFPELYAYPAKANFGFPLKMPKNLCIFAARAWRKVWSEVDDLVGRPLGVILYHHPRLNYAHPRELYKKIHRPHVVDCLESLRALDAFNAKGLENIKHRYLRRKAVNTYLLRGLLTVHQWTKRYGIAA